MFSYYKKRYALYCWRNAVKQFKDDRIALTERLQLATEQFTVSSHLVIAKPDYCRYHLVLELPGLHTMLAELVDINRSLASLGICPANLSGHSPERIRLDRWCYGQANNHELYLGLEFMAGYHLITEQILRLLSYANTSTQQSYIIRVCSRHLRSYLALTEFIGGAMYAASTKK